MILFVYQVADRTLVYFDYNTTVSVKVRYTDQVPFPAVTICDINTFRFVLSQKKHRPQRSWGKVMFLYVSVIMFTGGCIPACTEEDPPRAEPPPEKTRKTPPRKKPGSPPPSSSACWEIRATSGLYAFYWNAYLSEKKI